MFVSGTASAGVILHEELSTDERPAQRLRPVHPGGQSESPLPPRPSIPTENLLDQMDIYALSPHAAALSLPRMVSPQLVLRAHAGKGTLLRPPSGGNSWPRPAAATGSIPGLSRR
ncbi:MAG: hypothetical protein ACLR7Z_01935 [Bilophila wadsworthia]